MKINLETVEYKIVPLGTEIPQGEAFRLASQEYLRGSYGGGGMVYATNLDDGTRYEFLKETPVIPIDGEFVGRLRRKGE